MVKQVIIVYRNANKFYPVEVQLTSLSTCEESMLHLLNTFISSFLSMVPFLLIVDLSVSFIL